MRKSEERRLNESHANLSCDGVCKLSVDSIVEAVKNALPCVEDVQVIVRDFPEADPNSELINIISGPLCSNNYIYIAHFTDSTLKASCCEEIHRKLISKSEDSPAFVIEDSILLYQAVHNRDLTLLTEILRKKFVPRCCLQSCLLEAIWKYFHRGVEVLLQNGASASTCLRKGYPDTRPIQLCMQNFCEPYLNSIIGQFGGNNNADILEKVNSLTESLKFLLAQNTEKTPPFAPTFTGDDDFRALQELYQVAVFSPEIVEIMIEKASPYFSQERDYESPLAYAFEYLGYDIDNGRLRGGFPISVVVKIFVNAVIPLVRAGLRQKQSERISDDFSTKFGHLFRLITDQAFESLETFQEIVIESQCYHAKPLDVAKLKSENQEEFLFEVTSFICRFPRKLQYFARKSVLSCLPCGLAQRKKAIQSLELPSCLKNFLNYPEFDKLN